MNTKLDKKITTQKGYNIRVTAKTKKIAEEIQRKISEKTGANKPIAAIVGEAIYQKAVELGIEDALCPAPATPSQDM